MQPDNVQFESHVGVRVAGETAVDCLQRDTGLSKGRIKSAMQKGAVWLTRSGHTRRLRRATRRLNAGDEIHLYYDPIILEDAPAEPQLIADVGEYSVWDKPFGLRSQGSKWGDHCTITRWAERQLTPERPAFVVHRLDRAANGLILVAHSKRMAGALSALFRQRAIEKRYSAWVAGEFPAETGPLRVESPVEGKRALSEVSLVQTQAGVSQLAVRIETGRKHQIRRHLAGLGHPVLGDRLYGEGVKDGVDLQLRACLLAFDCPASGGRVRYQLPDLPPPAGLAD